MSTTILAAILTGVVSLGFGLLTFLAKQQFGDIKNGISDTRKKLDETVERTNQRIEKLEQRTDEEIDNLKKEISDIKGDFAITFVTRDEYFRSMNSLEDKVKGIDSKIDQVIFMIGGKK